MKNVMITCIAVLVLATAAYCAYYAFLPPSEEQIIKDNLQELAKAAGRNNAPEGIIVSMEHAKKVSRFFTDSTSVKIKEYKNEAKMTRENIAANVLILRKYLKYLQISVYDATVSINPDGNSAVLDFTAMVNAEKENASPLREARELRATLKKVDGKWLFERIEMREIITK